MGLLSPVSSAWVGWWHLVLAFSGGTLDLLHMALYSPVGTTEFFNIVGSGQHFQRAKEDISRHLGNWVVELT